MANWIVPLIEFRVSNNSSCFTLFISSGVCQSSKKLLKFCKINSSNSLPHLCVKKSRQTNCFYFALCLTYWSLLFSSLEPAMCNCTFCSPKHELSRGHTAWKVSKCRICSGPYFPVFELNTEINGVNLHIESEYRKMRTRKTPYLDTFYAVLLAY